MHDFKESVAAKIFYPVLFCTKWGTRSPVRDLIFKSLTFLWCLFMHTKCS